MVLLKSKGTWHVTNCPFLIPLIDYLIQIPLDICPDWEKHIPSLSNGFLNATLWEISAHKIVLLWAYLDFFKFKTQCVIILVSTTKRGWEVRKCSWEATGLTGQRRTVYFNVPRTWSPLTRYILSSQNPKSFWNPFSSSKRTGKT